MKALDLLNNITKPSVLILIVMMVWLVAGIQSPANAFSVKQEIAIDQALKLLDRSMMSRSWKPNLVRISHKGYVEDNARAVTGDTEALGGRPPGSMPGVEPEEGDRPPGSMPGVEDPGGRPPGGVM